MLTIKTGDIFMSKAQTLVNPVNCVGVMGKGLAREFKRRYPDMFENYRQRCRLKEVLIGSPYLWQCPSEPHVLLFPTKYHWQYPSSLGAIEDGLEHVLEQYQEWGITSLAMPALGCGLGGLKWEDVQPIIIAYTTQMDIPVTVYQPFPDNRSFSDSPHVDTVLFFDDGVEGQIELDWTDITE